MLTSGPEMELLFITTFPGPYRAVVVFTLGVAGKLRRLGVVDVAIQERHQVLHQPVVHQDFAC